MRPPFRPGRAGRSGNRDGLFMPTALVPCMPTCPDCGDDTTKRLAVLEPSELTDDRDYCLTCETYVDDDARRPATGE